MKDQKIEVPPLPAELRDVEPEARAYAYAAVEADRQRRGEPVAWQPIETAPRGGQQILLTNGETVAQGWWEHEEPYIREKRDIGGHYIGQDESDGFDGWLDCEGGMQPDPTHWMPLPHAPQPAEPVVNQSLTTGKPDYSEMSREQLERHAARMAQALGDAKQHEFFLRYALGPKSAPSCICCGHVPEEVAIRHAELPGIVVCRRCHDASLAEPVKGAPSDALSQLFREAIAWGHTYGPILNIEQWERLRDEQAAAFSARYQGAQPAEPVRGEPSGEDAKLREFLHDRYQSAPPRAPDPLDYSTKNENYVTGWNDCRAAMLAAAPTPPAARQEK